MHLYLPTKHPYGRKLKWTCYYENVTKMSRYSEKIHIVSRQWTQDSWYSWWPRNFWHRSCVHFVGRVTCEMCKLSSLIFSFSRITSNGGVHAIFCSLVWWQHFPLRVTPHAHCHSIFFYWRHQRRVACTSRVCVHFSLLFRMCRVIMYSCRWEIFFFLKPIVQSNLFERADMLLYY